MPEIFIAEPVTVVFDTAPVLEKRPPCPDAFMWRGEEFRVTELLGEWRQTARRGNAAHNMRSDHAQHASIRGSWGVGRTTFRVRTEGGRVFDLYYDRAPQGRNRKGSWVLFQEVAS